MSFKIVNAKSITKCYLAGTNFIKSSCLFEKYLHWPYNKKNFLNIFLFLKNYGLQNYRIFLFLKIYVFFQIVKICRKKPKSSQFHSEYQKKTLNNALYKSQSIFLVYHWIIIILAMQQCPMQILFLIYFWLPPLKIYYKI